MRCKFRSLIVVGLVPALVLLINAGALAGKKDSPGIKKTAIVGTFQDKSDHPWYHGANPGHGMEDMLITALVKSGKFKVYERMALDEILKEKGLSESDLANAGVEASKKLDIGDVLVKATITEFGYKEKKIGGSLVGKIGGGLTNYTARVAVDLRIISIGSSEVLWADEVAVSKSSKSIGLSTSKFSFGDKNSFDDHIVGKATREVINKVVEELKEQTKNIPWTGILVGADEFLFVDAGSEIGIATGMEFDVKRVRKVVKHPKTGKVLKILYDEVGVVKATEVEEGVTTVEIVSGTGFQDEDMVTLKKD